MTSAGYLAFLAVSTAVIVIPGPSIMLIVATALRNGRRPGLYAVAGISVAMAAQLAVAVAGLTSLVTQLAAAQSVLRWAGVACLVYLGVRQLRERGATPEHEPANLKGRGSAFGEGFLVALTNPATMLFFLAFFPQFLSGAAPPQAELLLMGVTFWLLALAFDCGYAVLAASVGRAMREPRWAQLRNRVAGIILLAAALALALARIRDAAII